MTGPYKTPTGLGDKGREASRETAAIVADTAAERRTRALELIRAAGAQGMTADEVAAAMGLSPFSIRPRISELANKGLIYEAAVPKRASANGRPSTVWGAE